ncbi:MAG: winged helix DNA-binding protein [Rhodobacteraceae bacterium]|nr:winged helix DNA-binding protein [Paracoccaceae bacterium]
MKNRPLGPVVSSSHLAHGPLPELSELEFGMTIASNAFQRWTVRAMAAAGQPDLSSLEVQVLHSVHHRERAKTLADICLVLNMEDTYTVNYAIKKLARAGLVVVGKQGKEKTVAASEKGAQACERYREVREQLLLQTVSELGIDPEQISRLSGLLRLMSGHYDQAARAAAAV